MKNSRTHIVVALSGALLSVALPTAISAADEKNEPAVEAVSIFNGKNLEGWVHDPLGKASYEVVDGAIVGTTVEGSPNSFLLSEKQYGDFELTFEVKVDDGLNSGMQIRSRPKIQADIPKQKEVRKAHRDLVGRVFGPQVEIQLSPGLSGYIYGEATEFGWLSPKAAAKGHAHKYIKNGEWNQYRVLAKGPRIQTWINGNKVADLTHEGFYKTHPKGHFGLQVHAIQTGTGPFSVRWKNIKVRELPSGEPAKK